MADWTDRIDDDLRAVIEAQHVFFVATATADSRINLSPKGMDTLRVLDDTTVAYLDYTGSGNETATHVVHDGRLTMMLCRFDRKPDIIRLYGRGRLVPRGGEEWAELAHHWEVGPGARQLIVLDVEDVQTSCGYAVPVMEFVEDRQSLIKYAQNKGEDGMREYRAKKNTASIDGLPSPPSEVVAGPASSS